MGFIPDLDACRFACVSHVTGTMEPENSVIYNPILSMERNICIIRDITKNQIRCETHEERTVAFGYLQKYRNKRIRR